MTAVRKDRNMNVSTDVTRYIKGRANTLVTIDEICDALNLDPAQARYAMRRLIEKTTLGKYINVVTRGNSWQVGEIPGANAKSKTAGVDKSEPRITSASLRLEPVGTLQDGTQIVRDAQHRLYRLIEL